MPENSCVFWTPTSIPIESFTTFGLNAKPNTTNPIGFFGTGLKYAVSVILRHGGNFRLFVDGTEYEFYCEEKLFRGTKVQQLRMRKRYGFGRWRSSELPFTLDLGKNWSLWMAFRELMSNTKDEGGSVNLGGVDVPSSGTYIEIDCEGFATDDAMYGNEVFLNQPGEKVFTHGSLTIYDAPSNYIYYRGVRVHDLRFPARFTYDFSRGAVDLSEDRSARNSFSLMYAISKAFMCRITDKKIVYKALNSSKKEDSPEWFEGRDLIFNADDYDATSEFKSVARDLSLKGFASPVAYGYHASRTAMRASYATEDLELSLSKAEWEEVIKAVEDHDNRYGVETAALQRLKDQLSDS